VSAVHLVIHWVSREGGETTVRPTSRCAR